MSDLQTLNDVIEQVAWMKKQNYSLVPYILNIDETLESLERVRDFIKNDEICNLATEYNQKENQ